MPSRPDKEETKDHVPGVAPLPVWWRTDWALRLLGDIARTPRDPGSFCDAREERLR